ncbi:hypothetical protein GCM10010404_85810 [Nonomuraea africana]|uniref:Uncharacterized protein n=1 Tax=Nonomuraea africana TaxID=46171 RepID=A0ABR9K897_9ACTN|nr:hypothetical protein [Nonomuraea africana]MBE1558230.1 hypothetical protein [Nonomuraea africana]
MTSTTTDDRLDWQQRSHAVLGRLLQLAKDQDLPVISWTITDAGAGPLIVGNCYTTDPIQRQRDFDAWVNAVDATEWPNGIHRDGVLKLHAHREHYDGLVSVSITAEILDDER